MPTTKSKTDRSNIFAFSAPDSFVALFVARIVIGCLFVIKNVLPSEIIVQTAHLLLFVAAWL